MGSFPLKHPLARGIAERALFAPVADTVLEPRRLRNGANVETMRIYGGDCLPERTFPEDCAPGGGEVAARKRCFGLAADPALPGVGE